LLRVQKLDMKQNLWYTYSMKIDIAKVKWAIKTIEKSNMGIGITDAKAIDIAVDILRQVRDGDLVPKEKGEKS